MVGGVVAAMGLLLLGLSMNATEAQFSEASNDAFGQISALSTLAFYVSYAIVAIGALSAEPGWARETGFPLGRAGRWLRWIVVGWCLVVATIMVRELHPWLVATLAVVVLIVTGSAWLSSRYRVAGAAPDRE